MIKRVVKLYVDICLNPQLLPRASSASSSQLHCLSVSPPTLISIEPAKSPAPSIFAGESHLSGPSRRSEPQYLRIMETSIDAFGSSTAPLTWHDFLERMRQPSAAEFVKAIKSFIVSFMNNPPDGERDSAAVQAFLGNMEAAFRAHSLWAGSSEEELESAGEGLEKYVMTKLFPRVFASLPEDVKADEQLYEKISLVQQFIRPENLDIKPAFQNETSWPLAQKELQKINMYKAPRDKLVCILSCCKVISNLLINASIASNENPPGADEFLPVLIYVIIKANPPQLHSNLLYIQRYRRQTRLVSEAAYFFTNMLSAASFIMNIDAEALSMDETEYEKNMELAQTLLSGISGVSETSLSNQNVGPAPRSQAVEGKHNLTPNKNQVSKSAPQFSSGQSQSRGGSEEPYLKDQLPKIPSVSDLENKGASILLKDDKAGQVFVNFPFLYSQAANLTIGDVEDLLNNYKELVFKYVCLAKGLGLPSPSEISTKQNQNGNQSEKVEGPEDISEVKSSDLLQKDFPNTTNDSNEKLPADQHSDPKLSEDEPISSTQTQEADEVSQR